MEKLESRKLKISDWSLNDRPREKCLEKGFHSLSDAELIAILIRNGSSDESAVDLGKRILSMNGNSLNALADMNLQELLRIYGIGTVKAITIKAAFELGQRRRSEKITVRKRIKFASDIVELMQDKIAAIPHEEFWVVFVNQSTKILGIENFGKGGLTSTTVDIRMIVKRALECNATGLLLCHNHPSGEVMPSAHDRLLTQQIKEALQLFTIKLLDHLILYHDIYYSFQAEGLL